jgi:hypothetical protein
MSYDKKIAENHLSLISALTYPIFLSYINHIH